MKIKVKKLKENTKLPQYAHPGDVGMDLYSMETITIKPGEHAWELGKYLSMPVPDKELIPGLGENFMRILKKAKGHS